MRRLKDSLIIHIEKHILMHVNLFFKLPKQQIFFKIGKIF